MNVSHFNRLRRSKTKEGPVLLGPAVFIVLSAVLCAGNHILKVTMIKRTLIKIAKCVERRILERRRVGTESYFQIYEGPLLGFLLVPECTLLQQREQACRDTLALCTFNIYDQQGPQDLTTKQSFQHSSSKLILGEFQTKM